RAPDLPEQVERGAQLRLGVDPATVLEVEGAREPAAKRDGAPGSHPLRLCEGLIDGAPDASNAAISVEVVLPQAKVDVEGLIDVEGAVGEPLALLFVALGGGPFSQRMAGERQHLVPLRHRRAVAAPRGLGERTMREVARLGEALLMPSQLREEV